MTEHERRIVLTALIDYRATCRKLKQVKLYTQVWTNYEETTNKLIKELTNADSGRI